MALVKCKECGSEISNKAKTCPNCGAKVPAKTSAFTWLVLIIIVVFVYVGSQEPSTTSRPASTSSSSPSSSSTTERPKQVSALPQWRSFTSKDEMTGAASTFAVSPNVEPNQRMTFPYGDVEAWLGVGCDGSSEWAYVGFSSAPNLSDDETESGYNVVRTRIRWDEHVTQVELTQKWGASFLHFVEDESAIMNIAKSNSVMLALQWHGQRESFFEFPLRGSAAALSEARTNCASF